MPDLTEARRLEAAATPIRSMRDYVARFYPDGGCSVPMAIGWHGTRVESPCGMKGYHLTIAGEWRCCEHAGCDEACCLDGVLARLHEPAKQGSGDEEGEL